MRQLRVSLTFLSTRRTLLDTGARAYLLTRQTRQNLVASCVLLHIGDAASANSNYVGVRRCVDITHVNCSSHTLGVRRHWE